MTYMIRRMTQDELNIPIEWATKEGWNPGVNDVDCFYFADPNGFFVGLLDNQPIATGAAVIYDDHYAFCGLYIVKPEYRGLGYGLQLTHERLNYVGNRITGLDGVLNKVSKYEKLGYKSAHLNIRYELNTPPLMQLEPRVSPIVDLKAISFSDLEKFDREYFPAPRSAFLKRWIHQSYGHALGYMNEGVLQGYGVIRKCGKGYKIGPLFARNEFVADRLFKSLCTRAVEGPIYLDVPEPNVEALALVKEYGMQVSFEVLRMYRNGSPTIDLEGIFGITTFELG